MTEASDVSSRRYTCVLPTLRRHLSRRRPDYPTIDGHKIRRRSNRCCSQDPRILMVSHQLLTANDCDAPSTKPIKAIKLVEKRCCTRPTRAKHNCRCTSVIGTIDKCRETHRTPASNTHRHHIRHISIITSIAYSTKIGMYSPPPSSAQVHEPLSPPTPYCNAASRITRAPRP